MPAPATSPTAAPRRLRLAPEARAGQILDAAARLLMAEGFTEVSMERLGREAGISKALVYNYFPNRNDLLRALLEREMGLLRENQAVAVKQAESFEELVRRTTRLYIENMQSRGPLLRKLWAEPAVARSLADENLRGRDKAMRYLARQVAAEYTLPPDVALSAVDMQMAMTEAAAQHLSQSHDDVDFATDICVTLLLGGLEALSRRHAKAAVAAARVARKAKAAKVAAKVAPAGAASARKSARKRAA
jgi:TetR/AcrR family transcriptional regulator, fatty acid biosynthesis regulator